MADYLDRAGTVEVIRTHGRREVAFLNRVWEDMLALDLCMDTERQAQPPAGPRRQHPPKPVRGL
ncbi:hypothetical protein H8S45_03750 [Agathobaculum sp. NSJ-28]|uniref:Uncharacterized protein n=2 Tax=Agathobaculum TaxID=2048137 RepID=A0A923RXP4_9FIRM|nr:MULTISPECIES: hypothetical protein [Butyricicoccaceae]MBC5724575.1 hypothetical protein [Agathobaculum faecis]MCU6788737.1 hypothetical protein [Agathobaculum ammoniilyticum]WOC76395.1 hypothetical protein RX717_05250 [Intestinibacillus sp. NTUH-41-i26]